MNPNCETDQSKVNRLLETIFFYQYLIYSEEHLFQHDKPDGYPVILKQEYHSQFSLNPEEYFDQNGMIRLNHVTTKDDRYWFMTPDSHYVFLDYKHGNSAKRIAKVRTRNITLDGVNYEQHSFKYLYGFYFHGTSQQVHHKRIAQNIIVVISKVGGILGVVELFFQGIVTFIYARL